MTIESANTRGIEYVRCNLCGSDDAPLLFAAPVAEHRRGIYARDVWPIVRCRRCGLVYTNPRIDDAARAAFYSFDTPGDAQFVRDWFIESADLQRPVWRRFARVIQKYQPAGRLLDVGCGAGTFLDEARTLGFDVEGQEVSDFFVDFCRRDRGLLIHGGFLETLDLPLGTYDVVTAFDVIEHHPDPQGLVRQMRGLLRPGGVAAVSTHDIGNPFARRYGVRWRYIRPIGHITYFTRDTLARMLEQNGFEVVQRGGIHTVDTTTLATWRHRVVQFFRVVVLRALVLGLYRPLANRWAPLRRWSFRRRGALVNHEKLLVRAGSQIIMDDDMVLVARAVER